jgi:hypothetical protein
VALGAPLIGPQSPCDKVRLMLQMKVRDLELLDAVASNGAYADSVGAVGAKADGGYDLGGGAAPAVVVPLGAGRSIEVQAVGEGKTLLRVRGDRQQQLQIAIHFDANGPVVSVVAPTLELEAVERIAASCESFSVDARDGIELRAGGDIVQRAGGTARVEGRRVEVEATPGAIRLKANDEVQVLGEMILLNCQHPSMETPMPDWIARPCVVDAGTPVAAASGDASVIDEMLRR